MKLKSIIDKGILTLFGLAYLFVSLVLLFSLIDESKDLRLLETKFVVEYVPNVVWVLLAAVLVVGFVIWNHRFPERATDKKRIYIEIAVGMGTLLILQAVVFMNIYFYPGADAHFVKFAAETFTSGNIDYSDPNVAYFLVQYFKECPNNIFLYFITIVFCYIGKIFSFNGYHLLMGFTVVWADAAIVLLMLTVYRLTGSRRLMRISFVMAGLLLGFSTWLFYPYTDSLTIIFPVLILYLYVRFHENSPVKAWQWFALAFIALFGYKIKALASLVFIALFCYELVTNGLHIRRIISAVCGCAVAVLLISVVNTGVCNFVNYEKDESLELPFIYFAALGSNYETYGRWTQEARDYICSFDTAEEKKAASWGIIKENYAEMGSIRNILAHYKNEVHYNYNDASFGVGVGVPFIEIPEPKENPIARTALGFLYPQENYGNSTYFGHGGEYYLFTVCLWQFLWMAALFLSGLTLLSSKENRTIRVLQITYAGILMYMLLFESNSRLMLCNVLVFILMGVLGLHQLCRMKKKAQEEKQKLFLKTEKEK